jgi:phosphoserine phosphatase
MRSSPRVLVLTTNGTISSSVSDTCIQILESSGANINHSCALGKNAHEIGFCGDDGKTIRAIRESLKDLKIDANILPLANRKKNLLIADMDSTIITSECIDELAALHGISERVKAITDEAMAGLLDFNASLIARVHLLKGLSSSSIEDILTNRIQLTDGACTLVQTMNHAGAITILATGGFTCIAEMIAQRVGFEHFRANQLDIKNHRLTGEVISPIIGKQTKQIILNTFMQQHHLTSSNTLAVGDGANDSAMIKATNLGVAFRAKQTLKKDTHYHIDHSDLTALLYLQGYKEAEFRQPV